MLDSGLQVNDPQIQLLPLQDALDEMKAEEPAPAVEVPDAEKHAAIKEVVDRVGYGLHRTRHSPPMRSSRNG